MLSAGFLTPCPIGWPVVKFYCYVFFETAVFGFYNRRGQPIGDLPANYVWMV